MLFLSVNLFTQCAGNSKHLPGKAELYHRGQTQCSLHLKSQEKKNNVTVFIFTISMSTDCFLDLVVKVILQMFSDVPKNKPK